MLETGQRFGRLVTASRGTRPAYWLCKCDCGETKEVRSDHLQTGKTRSCGCLRVDLNINFNKGGGIASGGGLAFRHRGAFKSWRAMMGRCLRPTAADYPRYGGRGVAVCERWRDFASFLADMGERPDGMTLDRIDPRGGYGPDNCRWATRKTQANNRISGTYITHMGETKNLKDWAAHYGINYRTFVARLSRYGMSFEEAISRPIAA